MHQIEAFVGSEAATSLLKRTWNEARRRELGSDLFIVPLTPEVVLQATGAEWQVPDLEEEAPKLAGVVAPLVDAIVRMGVPGTWALIFTQYFGGPGTQASLVVRDGSMPGALVVGDNAVDEALSQLGVRVEGAIDEFDTVGLGRWRSTESMADGAD